MQCRQWPPSGFLAYHIHIEENIVHCLHNEDLEFYPLSKQKKLLAPLPETQITRFLLSF